MPDSFFDRLRGQFNRGDPSDNAYDQSYENRGRNERGRSRIYDRNKVYGKNPMDHNDRRYGNTSREYGGPLNFERNRTRFNQPGYGRNNDPDYDYPTDEEVNEFQDDYGPYSNPADMDSWSVPGPYTGYGPRSYQRSDENIHEEICDRMTDHGRLDPRNIDIQVKNGEVTLTGTVHDRQAKRLAEDVADSVSGVIDVHNDLRVEPQPMNERK